MTDKEYGILDQAIGCTISSIFAVSKGNSIKLKFLENNIDNIGFLNVILIYSQLSQSLVYIDLPFWKYRWVKKAFPKTKRFKRKRKTSEGIIEIDSLDLMKKIEGKFEFPNIFTKMYEEYYKEK